VQDLKDYDYMGKHVQLPQDPFYVTGERYVDRCMLQAAMKNEEDDGDPLLCKETSRKWETANIRPEPIGGTRDENYQQARIRGFRARVGVAAIDSIFLIVPIWLMVPHDTFYTVLVSTTVFVAVFGLVIAVFLEKLMDVLSTTTAYVA
jgi:hypothetical protein